MESIAHSGDLGGPKMPEQENASEGQSQSVETWSAPAADRQPDEGFIPPSNSQPQQDPALFQIQEPLLREALRFRQNTSGSMTVIVCIEDGAELLVHFTQRDGGVDAIARCEPCDAPRLGALWPRLQEALGKRRIRLAPLRSVASQRPPSELDTSELRRTRNQLPLNRPGWETWA